MTNREIAITRFVRSRGCALLLTLAAITFVAISRIYNPDSPYIENLGIAFPSANTWLRYAGLSVAIGGFLNLVIAVVMVLINRSFNVLRTVSLTFAALFLLMQSAVPHLTFYLSDGLFMGLGMLLAITLMFTSYLHREGTPRVFLAFFIIGCGALWRLPWLAFLPAMFGGLIQMRILSLRTVLAAALGVVTPLWIVWGLGLSDITLWTFPELSFDTSSLHGNPTLQHSLAVGAVSLTCGALLGIANLFKILSYNAATRAYNGLLLTVSVTTGVMSIIDWQHISLYLTLLNACTAFQAGHFLKINIQRRGYLPILVIIAVYVTLSVSTMFIPKLWV